MSAILETRAALSRPGLSTFRLTNARALKVSAVVAVVGFGLLCQWPAIRGHPAYAAMNVTASTLLVMVGLLILPDPNRRAFGGAMAACGALRCAQFATAWNVSVVPVAAAFAGAYFYVVGGLGMVRYPRDLTRRHLDTIGMAFFAITETLMQVGVTLSSTNVDYGLTPGAFWPAVPFFQTHHTAVMNTFAVFGDINALIFLSVVVNRIRRMSSMDRVVAVPFLVGSVLTAATSVIGASADAYPKLSTNFFLQSVAVTTIPLSLLVVIAWQNTRHASVADELTKEFANTPVTTSGIRDALRSALDDATLDIAYWTPELSHYVDGSGHPVETPSEDDAFIRFVRTRNNEPLAMIIGSPVLGRFPRIVTTAVNTSVIALENAQLQANVLSQLEEVRQSRARIAQAGLEERQRIEGDLHDGLQQRLLALSAQIGTIERTVNDDVARTQIAKLGEEVRSATSELRDLVRGIHPTELRQFGLAAAIRDVTERLPIPVTLDISENRFSPVVEVTAYFVICEALSNILKHSGATSASVSSSHDRSRLELSVTDNGQGGIDLSGHGLTGLVDRVSSLGGTLRVSETGDGTELTASIPCVTSESST